ncbi:Uncharacterized protein FKW44_009635, partial [Caligus rogercresseyi]
MSSNHNEESLLRFKTEMAPIQAGNFISFMSKSKIHSEDQLCHWCGREKETSFHFFYFCPIIVPVVNSVEEKIQRTYGEHLEPPDWLISTSPNYENAFQIELIISKVQGVLYASRVKGNPFHDAT